MPLKEDIRHRYGDEAVNQINQLNYIERKYLKSSNDLTFLMRCRDNNITPKGLRIKLPVKSAAANKIARKAGQLLVKERIKHHRKTKATTLSLIEEKQSKLQSTLDDSDYRSLRNLQTHSNRNLSQNIKENQRRKFTQLLTSQGKTTTSSGKPNFTQKTVVNLSSKSLSDDQISLLSKGLNFVPSYKPRNNDDFIVNIERGLQQLAPGGHIDYLRHQINEVLQNAKPPKPNLTKREREAIKELKNDSSITIAPADKGKATVVLDSSEFEALVNNTLSDASTYKLLAKDPTAKYDRELRAVLKQLTTNKEIDQQLYSRLVTSHPRPPYARAAIKTHKDPVKARLIVCSQDTVHYALAQHLCKLLSPLTKTAKSLIKDSRDFCNNLKSIQNACQIVSYDVVDLFTNVPRDEAIEIIRKRIQQPSSINSTSLSPSSIIKLLKLCTSSTYFSWGDSIFEQTHGLPMGSPLSPLITEVYMMEFEETILQSSAIRPITWLREVDDVFAALQQNDNPTDLLDHLNSRHPRIKFTMETEQDGELPFLDVLVKNNDGKLNTAVYRKPTHSDQYLHYSSNHPDRVKTGIIATLTKRAISIPSTATDQQRELNHLQRVFTEQNGYPKASVQKIIQKAKCPTSKSVPAQSDNSPVMITIPYNGQISHKIARLIQAKLPVKTVFTTGRTLKTELKATGKKQPTSQPPEKSVVYKIDCDCKDFYIGETSRPLDVRIKEHKASVTNLDDKSAIAEHIKNNPGHTIQWEEKTVLVKNQHDLRKRKLHEALQIKRLLPKLNRDGGFFLPNSYVL